MPPWQPSDLNSLSEEEHLLGSQVSENGQTDSFASFLHSILSTFFTNDTLAAMKKLIMNLEDINLSKYKDPRTAQDQDPIVPQTSTKHAHITHFLTVPVVKYYSQPQNLYSFCLSFLQHICSLEKNKKMTHLFI
jgi:hypothetical protein